MDRLEKYIEEMTPLVNEALDKTLPRADILPATLHEAMRYSVFAGGKRIRPLLVMMSADLVGGGAEMALPAACALECLHTYSLIHDDLPSMDNDDMRRGKLTCHKAFDGATAILAGDALQALAFQILAKGYPGLNGSEAVCALAQAVGSRGMVGGQMLDLEGEGTEPDANELDAIHQRKTGALLAAACEVGGIIGGGGEEARTALRSYGQALGLCFQIVDDLLDVQSDAESLGKTPGKDAAAGKVTYPAVHGVEASREMAKAASMEAKKALKGYGPEALMLRLLTDFMLERTF